MKRRQIKALVTASVFVVSVAVAEQDRLTLKAPNGVVFAEFKGYEVWQVIAPSQPDGADGCGSSPAPGCIKAIVGNPAMVRAYADGVPANGKPVPDGAVLAKIEWLKQENPGPPYDVTVPGALKGVSFMLKDSKRFPGTDGWGYATFSYDAASGTWKPFGDSPAFAKTCHGCHALVKQRDFVYTSYAQR